MIDAETEWPLVLGALFVGIVVGALTAYLRARLRHGRLAEQAQKILGEAETTKARRLRDAEVEAKEAALKLQQDFDRVQQARREELAEAEETLRDLEQRLETRARSLDERDEKLRSEMDEAQAKSVELGALAASLDAEEIGLQRERERVAGLSQEAAKVELMKSIEAKSQKDIALHVQTIVERAESEADERSAEILAAAIQRQAAEFVSTATVATVSLPNDAIKGRIIGREGRNVRSFEQASGVDVIVDDTPGVVVVSCFHPRRREIGRLALCELIKDGRIHPARIEEAVARARASVQDLSKKAGEETCLKLGFADLAPELMAMIGDFQYLSMGGQNVLAHAREVVEISGMLAEALGRESKTVKRAALLSLLGRSADHEVAGTILEISAQLAKRFGEDERVISAIEGIGRRGPAPIDSVLIDAARRLSRQRPGAQRAFFDSMIQRLDRMESLARGFAGVQDAYVLQAGREIRVMVDFMEVDNAQALLMSQNIAREIKEGLTTPGEVRVTVLREARVTEVAK